MNITPSPQELSAAIGSENRDFAIRAGRARPLKNTLPLVIIGSAWTAFIGIPVLSILVPLIEGREVHFRSNGVSAVASLDNLGPLAGPAMIMGIFLAVGIALVAWGVHLTRQKGGFFVGTPTRLLQFQNGSMRSVDWGQFSGIIEVSGKAQKGDLSLQLRTGRTIRRKRGRTRYVPDVIYISSVPNVFDVERLCRKRIQEQATASAETEALSRDRAD